MDGLHAECVHCGDPSFRGGTAVVAERPSHAVALRPGDVFYMLPVYYAGGSASFKPTSDEVVAQLVENGISAKAIQRSEALELIHSNHQKGCVLVMGARDSSLRPWTATFMEH